MTILRVSTFLSFWGKYCTFLTISTVENYPHTGPQLATEAFNNDSAIFRGFQKQHTRLILLLEIEIAELEHKLNDLESHTSTTTTTPNWRSARTENNGTQDPVQKELLTQLQEKFTQYSRALLETLDCIESKVNTTSHLAPGLCKAT